MLANSSYTEKRDLVRMNMSCAISVHTSDKQFIANCNDFNGNGLRFSTSETMAVGDIVDIDIYPLNALTSPIFAMVEVLWVRPEAEDQYCVGAAIRQKN